MQNYLSCHALKIKSTQIIFKQETHSNIILTLTIHKQTSLNFDDKKYCIYWHRRTVSVSQYCRIIAHSEHEKIIALQPINIHFS